MKDIKFNYHKLIVFLYLTITVIPDIKGSIVNNFLIAITIISIIILLITTKEINTINANYIIWIFVILLMYLASILWAYNIDLAVGRNKRMIIIIVFLIYVSLLVKNHRDFKSLLKIFIYSRIILTVYIIYLLDFQAIGESRLGADNLGEDWNSNTIGMNLAFGLFSIYFLYSIGEIRTRLKKVSYLLFSVVFISTIILTGSRKALFIVAFSIVLFTVLQSQNKKLFHTTLIVLAITIFGYLSFNIPILYEVVGLRIEGLIAGIFNLGEADASTRVRMHMITTGIEFFKESPWLGYGIDNFKQLYYEVANDFRYSHNNYVEILVSFGVIGTLLYYIGLAYVLLKTFNSRNRYLIFAFVFVTTSLIIDYGLVSYSSYLIQFFIVLSFIAININKDRADLACK